MDRDMISGHSRVLVRTSASNEWMAASLQNNASEIHSNTSMDLADSLGRLPNASSPLCLSAELNAGSQSHLVSLDVCDEHLKTLPECTSSEVLNLASAIAEINISHTSLSNIYIQPAAVQALSNSSDVSSAPQCQCNVSHTKKSPAKHNVQLPILASYADATNFAARFPELASEVLSRPLRTAATSGFANVEPFKQETGHSKLPEHTADRPNWALAPEETADSNDSARPGSSSIAPDEIDVDVEAAAGVCVSRSRQTKVSVRAPAPGDIGSSFDLESPEQSRNKRGSSFRRRPQMKVANSHIRFGGMRGFRDKQGNSTDYSSHSASSPVDWTLPETSDAPKHPGREEVWQTSCHAWDIIDDRSPQPKFDGERQTSSVEAFWDSKGKIEGFPNSQQAPQIDRWSRPVVQASWDYLASVPPEMPRSPQGSSCRPSEPSQQPPIEPVQSRSPKKLQTLPLVGWVSPSDIKGGVTSRHRTEPPRSLQYRPQPDGANEWHTSLPLRRILPGDVGHASTVVDNRLNDISIPTSRITTPSARKSFVREAIIKVEQLSEPPADIVKTRMFTQSVPLSPRPVLFRADSWNSAAPYEVLGTSRGEGGRAQKEPLVWRTAQTEVAEVAPVTADSNLPMKSVGHSMRLDGVVPSAPSPAHTLGDSVYQSSKPHVSATTATAETVGRVPELEVEASVDRTRRLHILKPKEKTIQSCPVALQSDLTLSKKRQRSPDSGNQSQIPLNASRGPEKPFAICEVPAYPSTVEMLGEGKGEIDSGVSSQVKIFLEDPGIQCFSDTTVSSTPERGSETQKDECECPGQHLEGYAWRMGRPVSGWRRGLLDQSLSQKYIPPPARRFPPSMFREKPGLTISEQNKIYTFKLSPIAPVPGSTSQDVKAAPEAQVKQSVSKVKLEAPQNTNATDAGRDHHTFAADVSAPEITMLTELGRLSSDALRGTSPLCDIANTDTDLASGNYFERSKSPLMLLSDSNCVLPEHKTISGALSSDKVETPDLLSASQYSSPVLITSQSMDEENMLDSIHSSPTPWLSNRMLSSHPSPKVVGELQWPPSVGIASSIHEHIVPRQDSIDARDYSHYLRQPPSSSSSPNTFSAHNQLPTAFVHDSACPPIQDYHYKMPSIHSELHRHSPAQPYFRPELTQDLVGTSGWIAYPNFDGDAQYLIKERGAFDIVGLSPQSEARSPPQGEPPLVNSSSSQRSDFMPYISSRRSLPSGLAFRTQYLAGQEPSFFC
ncbi:hypothetical protein DFS33DRAFT_1273207 [Desarmillaria ectypa]|nr:hypothetical protein DFS33DRAFT_1273207 [Desarmillaria ectypa]